MKRALMAAALVFALPAWAGDKPQPRPIETYSQKELLKNWALSTCFYDIAQDQATKDDASTTASAYLQFGHQQMQVYHELGKLVDEFVAKKYGGSVPSEYNTMKCIDLYHSKELDRLVTRLLKTKFEPE
jgi:hypothetical protein